MTIPVRPRRAALLCVHFTRNLAYYRAGWKGNRIVFPEEDLWKTINGNFLDIAVIEWCKLYADNKAYHTWRMVVVDPGAFLPQMINDHGTTDKDWHIYVNSMRTYRDKFVAHLDLEKIMNIPQMDLAEFATNYLYDTLKAEQESAVFRGLPSNLRNYGTTSKANAAELYLACG